MLSRLQRPDIVVTPILKNHQIWPLLLLLKVAVLLPGWLVDGATNGPVRARSECVGKFSGP